MAGTPDGDGGDNMSERILAELRKMNKVMILANGDKLETELARYASTDERKKVWALIDGKRDINELIRGSGLKKSLIYSFLAMLEEANLIEKSHGKPPMKTLEFVPASWVELLESKNVQTLEQSVDASKVQNLNKDSQGDAGNGQ